jgi:hypothetical protein
MMSVKSEVIFAFDCDLDMTIIVNIYDSIVQLCEHFSYLEE